jgi:hypothetical protein
MGRVDVPPVVGTVRSSRELDELPRLGAAGIAEVNRVEERNMRAHAVAKELKEGMMD